jgi:hypothetical protein
MLLDARSWKEGHEISFTARFNRKTVDGHQMQFHSLRDSTAKRSMLPDARTTWEKNQALK